MSHYTLTLEAEGSGWLNFLLGGGDGVPAFWAITNPEMSLVPSTDSIVSRNAVSLFCEPINCRINMLLIKHPGITTHGSVSAAKKATWHTSVLFMGAPIGILSAYCSSKTIGAISTKFIYAIGSIFTTSQTKFESNSPHRLTNHWL